MEGAALCTLCGLGAPRDSWVWIGMLLLTYRNAKNRRQKNRPSSLPARRPDPGRFPAGLAARHQCSSGLGRARGAPFWPLPFGAHASPIPGWHFRTLLQRRLRPPLSCGPSRCRCGLALDPYGDPHAPPQACSVHVPRPSNVPSPASAARAGPSLVSPLGRTGQVRHASDATPHALPSASGNKPILARAAATSLSWGQIGVIGATKLPTSSAPCCTPAPALRRHSFARGQFRPTCIVGPACLGRDSPRAPCRGRDRRRRGAPAVRRPGRRPLARKARTVASRGERRGCT